ncbi:MAG: TolC family protein [Acidobacteriota bacterium]
MLRALELTLERDPNIRLAESRIDSARGALLTASSTFDPNLSADLSREDSETPTDETTVRDTETLDAGVTWSQRLRSGQTLTPGLDLSRNELDSASENTATVSFALRQPLMRGRDAEAVTAGEVAAERELTASHLDLAQTLADRLQAVTIQYWAARAAYLDLEILRTTEESSRNLLATTRRLVEADLTPSAELVQLEADLLSREVSRLSGEQALYEAMQRLGAAIGLEPDESSRLPLPAEGFPVVPAPEAADPRATGDGAGDDVPPTEAPRADDPRRSILLRRALDFRADLRADAERLEAARLRLLAADDALDPQLDLVFTPSYSGFTSGDGFGDYFGPLGDNIPGLSATFALAYRFPLGNRAAEGGLLSAEASVRQQTLSLDLARRNVGAEVAVALDSVLTNARVVAKQERAVDLFAQALENEEKKLRVGSSTLIDVISQRDRLTSAQQRLNGARRALAVALVGLRFETGTLVRFDGQDPLDDPAAAGTPAADPRTATAFGAGRLRLEDFTTPPF